MFFSSALRMTGTMRPQSSATAMPDVDVLLVDDGVALDAGVEDREGLERVHGGLQDEGQVGELDPAALLVAAGGTSCAAGRRGVMSISNTVVTWAEMRLDSTMCSAVFRRMGDMGTTSTRSPALEGGHERARPGGAGGGAAAGAAGAAAGPAARARAPVAAPGVGGAAAGRRLDVAQDVLLGHAARRCPVPGISRMSTLCSAAILRTTGEERVWRSSSTVISRARLLRGAAAAPARAARGAARRRRWPAARAPRPRCRRRRRRRRGVGRAGGGAGDAGGGAAGGGAAARVRRGRGAAAARGGAERGGAAGCGAAGAAAASPSAPITPTTVLIGTVVPGCDADLLQHARGRGGDLGVHLVGGDLEQRLVALDLVADLLHPLGDGPLGDGLAHLGHDDVGHWLVTSAIAAQYSYERADGLAHLLRVGQEVLLERRGVGHRRVRRRHAHDGRVQVLEGPLGDEGRDLAARPAGAAWPRAARSPCPSCAAVARIASSSRGSSVRRSSTSTVDAVRWPRPPPPPAPRAAWPRR